MKYGESDVATVGDVTLKYVEASGVKICCYSESRAENRTQFSFFLFCFTQPNNAHVTYQQYNLLKIQHVSALLYHFREYLIRF